MSKPFTKICFLGAGNITEAIISGLLSSGRSAGVLVSEWGGRDLRKNIIATDIRPERLTYISHKFGIKVSDNNIKAVEESQIIILAVKPQQITELLNEISNTVKSNQLVISVAAGITTTYIEKFLKKVPVIRTMPNTSALVKEAITAICKGKYAKDIHEKIATELFSAIGKTISIPEKLFDTITAVSGSGPAYIFYLTEAIIRSAEKFGLNRDQAKAISIQTVYGAGKLMQNALETGKCELEILRQKVTSPGGTTEQAIKYLESKKFFRIIENAINRARKRSEELTKR